MTNLRLNDLNANVTLLPGQYPERSGILLYSHSSCEPNCTAIVTCTRRIPRLDELRGSIYL